MKSFSHWAGMCSLYLHFIQSLNSLASFTTVSTISISDCISSWILALAPWHQNPKVHHYVHKRLPPVPGILILQPWTYISLTFTETSVNLHFCLEVPIFVSNYFLNSKVRSRVKNEYFQREIGSSVITVDIDDLMKEKQCQKLLYLK